MLQPELKFRRDKIRYLMAQQGIDAALIACNVNLLYTYGEIVNGYLFLPLHSPALLFVKRPNNIVGEFVFPIRKPEQMVDLLKENGIPVASKIMLEAWGTALCGLYASCISFSWIGGSGWNCYYS